MGGCLVRDLPAKTTNTDMYLGKCDSMESFGKQKKQKHPTNEENLMPNLNLASSNGSKTDIMFGAKHGTFHRKLNEIFNPRTADVRGQA